MPLLFLSRNLAETVQRFASVRVLIVGDLMLDQYVIGTVNRVSPEAPVPVIEMGAVTKVLGGAGNVAANIATLGGFVRLVGVVGEDAAAADMRKACSSSGIPIDAIVTSQARSTTTKTRFVAGQQQICRLDRESKGALDSSTEDKLLAQIDSHLAGSDVCVLSDYDKGCLSHRVTRYVIESAAREGKPVIVDPKVRDFRKYVGATVITPNLKEAETAAGERIVSTADLVRVAKELSVLSQSALLITRGAEGMTLFVDGRKALHVKAKAKRVFDVTGAGDTVVSTLALATGARTDLKTAVHLANMAAGIVVQKPGTAQVTMGELLDRISSRQSRGRAEISLPIPTAQEIHFAAEA